MIYEKHNRSLDKEHLERLRSTLDKAYDLSVSDRQIINVGKRVLDIEDRCKGRFAGHLEDYVLLYYAAFTHFSKSENRSSPVIEIGTLFGCSTILIWHAIKAAKSRAKIYAVDPLEGYYGVSEGEKGEARPKDIVTGFEVDEATVRNNFKTFLIPNADYELITDVSQSEQVLERLKGLSSSFLFVDGDHTRSGLFLDLHNYLRLAKPSSTVVIDNFVDPDWLGVTEEIIGGRYFDAGLQPLAFEKRLLVCEKARRLKNPSVLSDICQGLLEIISSKDQSRNALRNKLSREEKRFDSLADERSKELKDFGSKSVQEISKLRGVLDGIGSRLTKYSDLSQNRSSEGLKDLAASIDSRLTELGEDLESGSRRFHEEDAKAIGDLALALQNLDARLSELIKDFETSLESNHEKESEAIDRLGLSLDKTIRGEYEKSTGRLDTIKSSFTPLRRGLADLKESISSATKELGEKEASALDELEKSMGRQMSRVSELTTSGFDSLALSLNNLDEAISELESSLSRKVGTLQEAELEILEKMQAAILKASKESDELISGVDRSLAQFQKNMMGWGETNDAKVDEVNANLDNLNQSAEKNHGKAMDKLTDLQLSLDNTEKADERHAAMNEQLIKVQNELGQLQNNFENTVNQLQAKELECLDNQTKVEALTSHLKTTTSSLENNNHHLKDLEGKLDSLTEQNSVLNENLRASDVELTNTRNKLESLIADHERARQRISEQEQKLIEAKKLRIEITHREESLKNELIRLASKSLITKKDKESIRNIL